MKKIKDIQWGTPFASVCSKMSFSRGQYDKKHYHAFVLWNWNNAWLGLSNEVLLYEPIPQLKVTGNTRAQSR